MIKSEPTPIPRTQSEERVSTVSNNHHHHGLNVLPHMLRSSIISFWSYCHPLRRDSYVVMALGLNRLQRVEGAIWEHSDTFWARGISWIILILLMWVLLYSIIGEGMTLRGNLFRLLFMIIIAYVAGRGTQLFKLPALLGMLVTGLLLRNVGFYIQEGGEYEKLYRTMKQFATTCGMVRAGSILMSDAIYAIIHCHQGTVLLGLGMGPSFLEAMVTALNAYYLFHYPITWALCLGFLLCPNSPSVISPPMIELMRNGYGKEKNIGLLVIGAAGLDVAFSVTVFDLCVALLFRHETLVTKQLIAESCLDILIDIVGGFVFGLVAGLLPVQHNSWARWKRTIAMLAGGMISVVLGPKLGFPGTGPLSCIITGFIASTLWNLQVPLNSDKTVNDIIQGIWIVVCPMLFAFTGSDVDISKLDWYILGRMLLIVLMSVLIRMFGCFLVLTNSGLNFKEALFVGLIFQGKAINQAALGTQIINVAWVFHTDDKIQNTTETVTMGVLSILICTPLAHLGAKCAGPYLLTKTG